VNPYSLGNLVIGEIAFPIAVAIAVQVGVFLPEPRGKVLKG